MYIWSCPLWPEFRFSPKAVEEKLIVYDTKRSLLNKFYSSLEPSIQKNISAKALTSETIYSSIIEGIELFADSIANSVSRRLGIRSDYDGKKDEIAEAVSQVVIDAVTNTDKPMTIERIFEWHKLLMKSEPFFGKPSEIGNFRKGKVFVVSGNPGNERTEFEGIPAHRVPEEMESLLSWIETAACKPIVKSAIASFWFVTIHPFGNGNGRISRALSDFILSRFESGPGWPYMSMSEVIDDNRNMYYWRLKTLQNQNSSMDVTDWIVWFIEAACLALDRSAETISRTIETTAMMNSETLKLLNPRQRDMMYRLISGSFYGSLTNKKWMKIEKCQIATATRDLSDLVNKGLLIRSEAGGRSTSYTLSHDYRKVLKE